MQNIYDNMLQLIETLSGIIVAAAIGLFCISSLSKNFLLVFLQVIAALYVEMYGYYFSMHKINDCIIYNRYYIPVNFILLLLAAYYTYQNYKFRMYIKMALTAFLLFWINGRINNDETRLDVSSILLGDILIIVAYFIIIINLMKTANEKLEREPLVWLCIGMLLYYAANIPILSSIYYIFKKNESLAKELYHINVLLNSVQYFIIARAFLLCRKQLSYVQTVK